MAPETVISVLVALFTTISACSESSKDPCIAVTCSGHGTCQQVSGAATCLCEQGFSAQDLTCIEDDPCVPGGKICDQDADCCQGICKNDFHSPEKYCHQTGCSTNGDCTNHHYLDRPMCCITDEQGNNTCIKVNIGAVCGAQLGGCGASCAGALASACSPELTCLAAGFEDPNAVCAHPCTTNADCGDCLDEFDPDCPWACQPISGGVTFCLPESCCGGCGSSLDCEGDDVCIPWPTSDELDLEGMCGKLGDLPAGSTCDSQADPNNLPAAERCAGFYCMNDHCSEVCTLQTDCRQGEICETREFPMDDQGDVFATIGMCAWYAGSHTPCMADTDCEEPHQCQTFQTPGDSTLSICVVP